MLGEAYLSAASSVCSYQDYVPGVFNYASYFTAIAAFQNTSGDISGLVNTMTSTANDCSDMSLLGTFTENHDQPRFAALNPDLAAATNVIAWTMLTDGIPVIYQGQEQHLDAGGASNPNDPYNREALWLTGFDTGAPLYTVVAVFNLARKAAIAADDTFLTSTTKIMAHDSSRLAMKKGEMSIILTNAGSDAGNSTYSVAAGYSANTEMMEVLTCDTLTTDSSGSMSVPMSAGQPRIYMPSSAVSGGLCDSSSKAKSKAKKRWPKIVHGPRPNGL